MGIECVPLEGTTMITTLPPAQLGLIGLCGGLSLLFAYEIAAPIPPFEAPRSSETFQPATITFQDTATAASLASFEDINAHPIFSASRAPLSSRSYMTHRGTSTAVPSDIALIGVIIQGNTRMA